MFIPLKYNLRNLAVRRLTTFFTALSIAVTVVVFVAVMALVEGMRETFVSTGDPLNVVAIRQGAQSETGSIIEPAAAAVAKTMPGLARGPDGEPLVSVERMVYVNIARRTSGSSNVVIRGTTEVGRALRPAARLVRGRWYRQGARELTVSGMIADRFAHCGLGDELMIGASQWRIVGIFDAGRTAYSSEMWSSAVDVGSVFQRPSFSDVFARAESPASRALLLAALESEPRLHLDAKGEREFYATQTKAAAPIELLGRMIAAVMAVGSAFAAMNAMYAAVSSRVREVAILRALGFTAAAVALSFVIEALLLATLGGVIGAAAALPLDGITTGTTNWFSFSEMTFAFNVNGRLMLRGIVFAQVMGLAGGVLPALRAARLGTVGALRAL